MQSTLASLKKDLKEEGKKCRHIDEVQISGDGKEVTLKKTEKVWLRNGYGQKNQHFSYSVEAKEEMNILYVFKVQTRKKNYYGMSEFAAEQVCLYFKKYADLKGMKLVLFRGIPLANKIKQLYLRDEKECNLEDWNKYATSFDYVLELEPHALHLKHDLLKRIWDSAEEVANEIAAFEYHKKTNIIPLGILYYYQGHEGEISFSVDNDDKLYIESDGNKEQINQEQIKNKIMQCMDKAKKIKRLHNIYNPPRKIFDRYIEVGLSFQKKTKEDIFDALSACYSSLEIDEKIAEQKKEEPVLKVANTSIGDGTCLSFFKLIDVYFIYINDQLFDYKKEKEEAKKLFYDEVLEHTRKALNDKFSN